MRDRLIELITAHIRSTWHFNDSFAYFYESIVPSLADYLIANGVIAPPCKVGDTVYMPWEWSGQKGIACLTVTVIRCICGFGWSFGTDFDTDDEDYYEAYNCGSFKLKDFGKIIFLTREEAEAKLKEGDG